MPRVQPQLFSALKSNMRALSQLRCAARSDCDGPRRVVFDGVVVLFVQIDTVPRAKARKINDLPVGGLSSWWTSCKCLSGNDF